MPWWRLLFLQHLKTLEIEFEWDAPAMNLEKYGRSSAAFYPLPLTAGASRQAPWLRSPDL